MKSILIVVLLSLMVSSNAQEATSNPETAGDNTATARFTSSVNNAKLGESFVLTLTVDISTDATITEWIDIDPLFLPLELITAEERTLSQQANLTRYQQVYHVELWDVGVYNTPEIRVIYVRNNVPFSIPVQSVAITVPAMLNDAEIVTIRASLPQQDLDNPIPLAIASSSGVAIVAVLLHRRLRVRRRDLRPVTNKVTQSILAQLEDLMGSTLSPEELVLASVERLRAYLAYQHGINAPELTSSEIIAALRSQRMLTTDHIRSLSLLLEQADLIKFANLAPTIDPKAFVKAIMRWIKVTDQTMEGLNG